MQLITKRRAREPLPACLSEILPPSLTDALDHCPAERFEEIRIHARRETTVRDRGATYRTGVILSDAEIADLLRKMCGSSLYAHQKSLCEGYLTMAGGLRVGVCGSAAINDRRVIGIDRITGLIIRIPHFAAPDVMPLTDLLGDGSACRGILIYSPPGVGKTTVLRALAQVCAGEGYSKHTVIVDTRREIGPTLENPCLFLDILDGYPREVGIGIAVRFLGAQLIVCDEIGSPEDADALLECANCGVPCIASAHASDCSGLFSRPALRRLHEAHIFDHYVGLARGPGDRMSYRITSWEAANDIF